MSRLSGEAPDKGFGVRSQKRIGIDDTGIGAYRIHPDPVHQHREDAQRGLGARITVTSGALSPTLGHPIAMALVEPGSATSDALSVDVRGTRLPAAATDLPFYTREARA